VLLSSLSRKGVCPFVARDTRVALNPLEFGYSALTKEFLDHISDGESGGLRLSGQPWRR